jgi:cytosine/adenosine deaminase-related metal-dependent hydrolase
MPTTKVTGRYVVAYDQSRESHRLLENGEVVFRGDSIVFVGFDYPGPVDRVLEAGNALVGPGFIDLDALGDLDSTVLGFDNHPDWAKGRVWASTYLQRGPRDVYSPDEEAFKMRYAFVQLLLNGITTALPITSLLYRGWSETADEFRRVADIAEEIGLRAYLGPAYRTGLSVVRPDGTLDIHWDQERGEAGLAAAVAFARAIDGRADGRIRGMLAPDRIECCTEALLRHTAAAGADLDCPVRLHCCQSLLEMAIVERRFAKTSLEVLRDLSFLNSRTILPHGVYVTGHSRFHPNDDRDLEILAESGASIVHCPLVMARMGRPMESFARLRGRGINLGLGTDTFPPDLVENMRQGVNLCRVVEQDPAACSAADLYTAATLGGAQALRRPDLGRLAVGAKADITIFDLGGFHLGQFIDPIQTMVLAGSGRDFKTVIIDGQVVVRDRTIDGIDLQALHDQAQRQFAKLRASYPERTHLHPPVEQIFAPSFPMSTRP